jgi:hypothetical protein
MSGQSHNNYIRHYTGLIPIPTSSPPGHVEFAVVLYGFLLFLSFSRPVRTWRYRWLLIPLELYALLDWLIVGIARVVERTDGGSADGEMRAPTASVALDFA